MEIKKIELNGNVFEFICDSKKTRSGFAHDCTLFANIQQIGKSTCYYYNRTWECYRYQTAMKCAVQNALSMEHGIYRKWFMEEKEYKRMTKKREEEYKEYAKQFDTIELLEELYEKL